MKYGKMICVLAAAAMGGCAVQKTAVAEYPAPDETVAWTGVFTDTCLQQLVSLALENNPDLAVMTENIIQADAALKSARLSYLPSFTFSASASMENDRDLTRSYEVPLAMSWELNLAGAKKAQNEAARFELLGVEQQYRYASCQLAASVANAYYTLIMLDRQIELTRQGIDIQNSTLFAIEALKEVGRMNSLAVTQARSSIEASRISLDELLLERERTLQSMNLLLARPMEDIVRPSIEQAPMIVMDFDSPVPMEALSRRPDVLSAEYELRSMFANVRVARSQFYPSIYLSASGTWTDNLGNIADPARMVAGLVAGLTQPLFQQGRLKAELKIAESRQRQARTAFEQALLQAASQVEVALEECRSSERRSSMRGVQMELCRQSFETSRELLEHSSAISYLEVLSAQQEYLNVQILSSADWLMAAQSRISLFCALCLM